MANKKQQAPASTKDAGQPVDAPVELEQTTDYKSRAGGYVLTDYGWVLADKKKFDAE